MIFVFSVPLWFAVLWLVIEVACEIALYAGNDYDPPSNSASTYVSPPYWQPPEDGRPMTWQTCNAVYEIEMQLKRVAASRKL